MSFFGNGNHFTIHSDPKNLFPAHISVRIKSVAELWGANEGHEHVGKGNKTCLPDGDESKETATMVCIVDGCSNSL